MPTIQPNSLGRKMTLLAIVASGIGSIFLIGALLGYEMVHARRDLGRRLEVLAAVVGENSRTSLETGDREAAAEELAALQSEWTVHTACLWTAQDNLLASFVKPGTEGSCRPRAELQKPGRSSDIDFSEQITWHGRSAGTLWVDADTTALHRRMVDMLRVTAGLMLMAMVISTMVGLFLQNRISRPLRDLVQAMRQVAEKQDFKARVASEGTSEFAELGESFNVMLAEIEKRDAENARFAEQLARQAHLDALTGLPNRRLLADRLVQAIEGAKRRRKQVALFYIDLDGFKQVNDTLGHGVGDLLLAEVSRRLQSRIRAADTLARLGGDEFAVVLGDISSQEQAAITARDLLEKLSSPFTVEGHEITVSASIGVTLSETSRPNPEQMFLEADSAMYEAKRSGKNRTRFYSEEIGSSLRERAEMERRLRRAIAAGDIRVRFQPKFDAVSRDLTGFEALAWWIDRELGAISPARFIPVAEESGLIIPLGMLVLEQACREAAGWQDLYSRPVPIAVNLSNIQLRDENFIASLDAILERTGLRPDLLLLELTESLMLDHAQGISLLEKLSARGVQLAIDDFGTGYSCLSSLGNLPFNELKIDMSFVQDLGSGGTTEATVRSMVSLGHNLGMRVIAEGVETESQACLLTSMGCDELQGYLLGRPTQSPSAYLDRYRVDSINEEGEKPVTSCAQPA